MNTRKSLLTIIALIAFCMGLMAQPCRKEFIADRNSAGNNYIAYPAPTAMLTPAPKGYTPVYLSHYGRHGSRYHIGSIYDRTYKLLHKADSAGVLTEKGKEVLLKTMLLRQEANGRDGELTELGALQHQQIAERMYNNFPEIFSQPIHIDAKSTVVIRCILSMESALQQLKSMNPKLDIRHDASYHDMYYMNRQNNHLSKLKKGGNKELDALNAAHTHPERLMRELFNNETYWRDSISASNLMNDLYSLAKNIQSSEIRHNVSLWDLFTDDEVYDLWVCNNASWYVEYGPSHLSGGIQPFSQAKLLSKMIEEADSCLRLDRPSANLRYGHETMVLPLTCLLDLNGAGRQIDDLEKLADEEWYCQRIFPMGCNIQMVFYKPTEATMQSNRSLNGDVLVKVMLNEREAHMPMETDMWPYYRWSDVRQYYLDKIATYHEVAD